VPRYLTVLARRLLEFRRMTPREVADLVAGNHRNLRDMLVELDAWIDRVVAEDVGATSGFYAHCETLCRALLTHIDLEDAVIVPLLRAGHPQGDSEAMELLRHHEAQRRWLSEALVRRSAPPTPELLRSVRALLHVLRVDMDHEDAELERLAQTS